MVQMVAAPRFLLVTDSPGEYGNQVVRETLSTLGSLQVASGRKMTSLLQEGSHDVVVVDAGPALSPLAVISRIREIDAEIKIVIISASPHWKIAVDVTRPGDADYLRGPPSREEIITSIRALLK
jgi:two-component system C4-dicarboxylate transport response regulator DctD